MLRTGLSLFVAVLACPAVAGDFVVTTAADGGAGSLRQAIFDANATPGPNSIEFAIPGDGPHSIALTTGLPDITEQVTLNAYSQPGAVPNTSPDEFNAAIMIHLDGSALAGGEDGLRVASGGSVIIRGFSITGFPDEGIDFSIGSSGGNRASGNLCGLLPDGTTTAANGGDGVGLFSPNNLVGGPSLADRNVLSGNVGSGVTIAGQPATGNRIEGNLIGTDHSGTSARPNSTAGAFIGGVFILNASGNTIGGGSPGVGNVISGNGDFGVQVFAAAGQGATNNGIAGNFIGTDVSGTVLLENDLAGVALVDVSDNIVGGSTLAHRNIIAEGSGNAIQIIDFNGINPVDGNVVRNNWIGLNAAGTGGVGPAEGNGVLLSADSNTLIQDNAIANQSVGIMVSNWLGASDGAQILANRIGSNAAADQLLRNSDHGIFAQGEHTNLTLAGNIIVGHDQPGNNGIRIEGASNANATLTGNFIGVLPGTRGATVFGNAIGVFVLNSNFVQIGGPSPADGNIISNSPVDVGVLLIGSNNQVQHNIIENNHFHGIRVVGDGSIRNRMTQNSISGNGSLGIELGDFDGVTANDVGDVDDGPNQRQNFPVLTQATIEPDQIEVSGTLDTALPVQVEIFANDQCLASGHGQGQDFLGGQSVASPSFSFGLPVSAPLGQFITATATDAVGNTSEFSACIETQDEIFADRWQMLD